MTAASLFINEEDRTAVSQWDATWEERVDGVGSASVTVQDRDPNSALEYGRGTTDFTIPGNPSVGWRDILQMKVGSLSLFWGEVVHATLGLPAGHPWRRWKLSATDFNTLLDTRVVGVPDGATWQTIDGGETYDAIDPNAHGLSRDGETVRQLLADYVELPRFVTGSIDTTTFVHDWIPLSVMVDPATGESRLRWTNTTLRGALDEMRGLAGFPVFCWMDPDLALHWEALQNWSLILTGGLPLLGPRVPYTRDAPAIITDDSPNGVTSVGGRDLRIEYDATYMPQQVYCSGVTDFIHNGGSTIYQGTGWPVRTSGRRDQIAGFRQLVVDGEAVTDREKSAVSASVINYARRARIRGTVTVGQPGEAVDGWRCGQLLTIFDARLPPGLNGRAYPIQRVAGSLKAGNEFRVYTLEFGDFPIARFSQKYRATPQRIQTARQPAREHKIVLPPSLRPSTNYTVRSQMVDRSAKPVRRGGIPVAWSLIARDRTGAPVGMGSVVAITSRTDDHGRTAATLTTGATTDVHYHLTCVTAAQS